MTPNGHDAKDLICQESFWGEQDVIRSCGPRTMIHTVHAHVVSSLSIRYSQYLNQYVRNSLVVIGHASESQKIQKNKTML